MTSAKIHRIQTNKKVYFASDFHLGAPNHAQSLLREKKIVRWLDEIKPQAACIFLVGDIFDFWFEYRHAIPKGFIRFQGKLAELTDQGIQVIFFVGNHDMWMFDYFTQELGIPIYQHPQEWLINDKKFMIGHGDGLGPGDHTYKILKKIFRNKVCQWLFARLHPNLGMGVAQYLSRRSRAKKIKLKTDEKFLGEEEWLLQYCRRKEQETHHDFYIFGHRHLPLDIPINEHSRYVNIGEWINQYTYAYLEGENLHLCQFEDEKVC